MRELDGVFAALAGSAFRHRMRLGAADAAYLRGKGLPAVLAHARDFVDRRLAPARPARDGAQTPMRGHPAFVAQHATATCCRGCLARWHGIPIGGELTGAERDHVVAAIERWLRSQMAEPPAAPAPRGDAGTPRATRRRSTRREQTGSELMQGDLFAASERAGR